MSQVNISQGEQIPAGENEAVVHRMIEGVWNEHDFTTFEEFVAADHFEHMAVPEYQHGVAGGDTQWSGCVFPDHRFDVEDAVANGYRVAVGGMCSGTHEG